MAINLVIIEDDPLLREELLVFLSANERIHCVLAVESIARFQQFYREFMQINIVLLDINLPGVSGIDGIPIIRRLLPGAEIVMHTVLNDYDTIFTCICSGANGYLLKDGNLGKLTDNLLEIETNEGCALTPSVARRIISYFQPVQSTRSIPEPLSEIELKISRFLVDGLSYQEIADVLNLSIHGVRYHIKHIYRKLHINSKGGLFKQFRQGLIDL